MFKKYGTEKLGRFSLIPCLEPPRTEPIVTCVFSLFIGCMAPTFYKLYFKKRRGASKIFNRKKAEVKN